MMSHESVLQRQGPIGLLPSSFGLGLNFHPQSGGSYWSRGVADLVLAASNSNAERFRRRLEIYRRRHNCSATKYGICTNAVEEEERQKTATLRQRWLDSRTKRTLTTKSKTPAISSRKDSTSTVCDLAGDHASKTSALVIAAFDCQEL